jgi:hypothetical protein
VAPNGLQYRFLLVALLLVAVVQLTLSAEPGATRPNPSKLLPPQGHTRKVYCVALSTDGKHIDLTLALSEVAALN